MNNTEVTYSLFPPFKPDCFSIPQMQRIFPSFFSLMNSFVLLFLVLSHLPPRLFRLITLIFCSCRGFVLQLCPCQAGCSWSLGLFFCVLEVCEESQTFRAGNCSLVTQKLEEKSHTKILREKLKNSCSTLWSVWSSVQFSYKRSQDFKELRK